MTRKRRPKRKKLPKIISREDAGKLLAVPNPKTKTGLRNRVLLLLLYRCGLRSFEVCDLSVHDVDPDRGFVHVQQGKGGKERIVPMDQDTAEWCRRWLEIRPASPWFVTSLNGNQLTTREVRAIVERISRRAGVYIPAEFGRRKTVHPHALRHTFATERLEEGFTLAEVAKLLGHEDISTTSVYLHVRDTVLEEKMRNLPPIPEVTEVPPCPS